ncbi:MULTISPECIES: putative quinol monooxygenase [Pseudomonas syringae group]|uniref:Antibiotic biosynthesis monooxygenase n=2 Tax=Pseudomonas syringae group TaxID=136849 RepID=A0AB37QLL3_9PSED|nr:MULTISPECIES: putative quinol monooxygenase [Pseudomonas syringae group]KGS11260.1 antibiotic biosynthesis monooxygenase [Pseudomonas coronafaciens]KPW29756.1 Antibiotic biosynthesis monooxygenase [Pseudomonas coronafaciens pv. atropurpurea]KPX30353.1 Antibiotic biosynthesis monooxygenase [Pseudomonas coronafaciens pv. garcae]KPZ25758.1 Antibiotic biosynthesis monooxygenase [Pseudomonas coronafaciens pv. zizaniae]MCF5713596.1 antibiotic biosynthesis monooxygenase [Pseudomonas tremae]
MNTQVKPIVLIAVLKARPGKEAALKEALLTLVEPSRSEPGNIEYVLFEKSDEAGTFYMRECFEHQAALDAHVATAHYQQFSAAAGELLATPPQLIFLDQVSH